MEAKKRAKFLKRKTQGSTVTYTELQERIFSSSKSCILDTFTQYMLERREVSPQLTHLYNKHVHRALKFTVFLRTKSSEDKLIHRIRKTFESVWDPKSQSNVLLVYGSWGRNPNCLKSNAPTPGIGLRRRLHKIFKTITLDERGTSIICPAVHNGVYCGSPFFHPSQKDPITGEQVKDDRHVLRCQSDSCRTRWDRDLLAVANQWRQAMFIIKNVERDPAFSRTSTPLKSTRFCSYINSAPTS
jgi:hypothetical protein